MRTRNSRFSSTWPTSTFTCHYTLIFTSDNGPECIEAAAGGAYEHARQFGRYNMAHLRGVKRDTWEGGHCVPFFAKWPRVTPAGSICNQLISLSDLLTSCAELLDIELPEEDAEDSVSILPLLQGDTEAVVRNSIIHHSYFGRFAIRKNHWVFIDAPSGDDNREPDWFRKERGYSTHDYPGELFVLREDIEQRTNLYGEQPEVVQELSTLLKQAVMDGQLPHIP